MCYNVYDEMQSTSNKYTFTKEKKKMATKKNFHYVLVFTEEGPVYVTSVNNATHYAKWDKNEIPKAFPKYYAEDLVLGLNLNFHNAVLVTSKFELSHPYSYSAYDCKFVRKEE
jgi:hypothetical protein